MSAEGRQRPPERQRAGDEYFKVQVYDPQNAAWRDVQKRHYTLAEARAHTPPGGRVMRVTGRARQPEPVDDGDRAPHGV